MEMQSNKIKLYHSRARNAITLHMTKSGDRSSPSEASLLHKINAFYTHFDSENVDVPYRPSITP